MADQPEAGSSNKKAEEKTGLAPGGFRPQQMIHRLAPGEVVTEVRGVGHVVSRDPGRPTMPRIFQSLIQSDLGGGASGNLEAVIIEGGRLVHWFRDDADAGLPWRRAQVVATGVVVGPGALIQSDFGSGDHGNFEVVVPIRAGDDVELWHFFHDNSDVSLPWQQGQLIAVGVAGPGALIQSDFGSGDHGNFEVVVRQRGDLVHYWHDNSDVSLPWQQGQTVTGCASGWAALTASDFGLVEHGHRNFELLADELAQSVVSYWHPNQDVALPWLRHRVLIGEPYPPRLTTTRRIVQLTGEYDREGWSGAGAPAYAFNRTETQPALIRGCDLGSSFAHHDRVYFLFGDTWHTIVTQANLNLDSVAYTTDRDASSGVPLTFLVEPPLVDPPVDQRAFNVPLEGTSHDGEMYVFFSTDHWNVDGVDLMGRSLLARCTDEARNRFEQLASFSARHFINVSVVKGVLDGDCARQLGWRTGTPVLWMWGSGRYRMSEVRLAVVALADLASLKDVRYFAAGPGETSRWSADEGDAAPVIRSGSVGELSVRWNPHLGRYLALFNADNPSGILMHSSATPWGPWSIDPVMVFDAWWGTGADGLQPGDGMGRFMHRSWAAVPHPIDHVQDDILPNPGDPARDNVDGGAYGPYQIAPYAAGENGSWTRLYFTMSTWNPYQVMLMTTKIAASDIAA